MSKGLTNNLFLQKGVLDVTITYSNATISTPISLHQASGIDQIMTIDAIDNQVEFETTATGDSSIYMQGTVLSGAVTLHPQSPALVALHAAISTWEVTGIAIPGTITVSGNGFDYVIPHVVFTSPATVGYSFERKINDYTYAFKARPPTGVSLAGIVNAAGGLVNIV